MNRTAAILFASLLLGSAGAWAAPEMTDKHLVRMNNMTPKDFCMKELRKLAKVKGTPDEAWFTALSKVAAPHGVNGHHLTLVQDGHMEVGMPMCAAIASWGQPDTINRTQASYGRHEQWVYGNGHYIYFEEARLVTTIQTRR